MATRARAQSAPPIVSEVRAPEPPAPQLGVGIGKRREAAQIGRDVS